MLAGDKSSVQVAADGQRFRNNIITFKSIQQF